MATLLSVSAFSQSSVVLGQLMSIDLRQEGGIVRRVSAAHPDGEVLGAGAYLYPGDRIGLIRVSVTVMICGQEAAHSALAMNIQLEIPEGCFVPNQLTPTEPMPPSGPSIGASHASASQVIHTVAPDETIYAIARRYNVTPSSIVDENALTTPDRILVGDRLVIPNVQTAEAMQGLVPLDTTATPTVGATSMPAASGPGPQLASVSPEFRLPVEGRLVSNFAESLNTGVNVLAPVGSPVLAADGGTVIYVGDGIEGYGRLVLIRHPGGYVSAYAHLDDILVSDTDAVSVGQQIGTVGMTGSVTEPQLHFELRRGAAPIDPMPFLAGYERWLPHVR